MKKLTLIFSILLFGKISFSQSLLNKTPSQIKTIYGEPNDFWEGYVVYDKIASNDWLGKFANRLFIDYAATNIVKEYIWTFADKGSYDNAVNTLRYKSSYVKAINLHYFYDKDEYGFIATAEEGFQIKVCTDLDIILYIALMEGNLDKLKVKLK